MTNKGNALTKLAALLAALTMLTGSFPVVYSEENPEGENVTELIETLPDDVTEEEVARIASEEEIPPAAEETVQIAAGEEAPPAAEETEQIATEEEIPPAAEETEQIAAEEEASPAAEETEQIAAGEETPPAAEEQLNEVVAEFNGSPAPELEAEPEDDPDDDWDELDDDWDELEGYDDFGEDGEFEEFEDWDAGYISEELLEQFNNPDNYAQVEFSGSADIELKNQGDLHYGDEIVLLAKVRDANLSYRLVWEANDSDDRGWYTIGRGEEFSYTLTKENVDREFRVVLFTVD